MITKRLLIGLLVVFMACLGVYAQEFELEKHPGYINLEEIKIPDESACVTDISIGPAVLKFTRWMQSDDEDDCMKLFSGILSFRAKAFEIEHDDPDNILRIVKKIDQEMEEKQWESLLRVKKEDERMDIRVKFVDKKAVGIFLMAYEPGDGVAFLNVVGDDINIKNLNFFHKGCFGFKGDWF